MKYSQYARRANGGPAVLRKGRSMPRPRRCPQCGSNSIASILWGLPSFDAELERDIAERRVVTGGCCVTGSDPQWHCNTCGHEWGAEKGLEGILPPDRD